VGVLVLGMHRSGTSAVARAIDELGVPLGSPLLPARFDNPAGYGEVEPLMHLNDELLRRLGGSWDAPPRLEPGWERAAGLGDLAARAAAEFGEAHQGPAWVWKDPRVGVLLPFWRRVIGGRHVAVVVVRDPVAVTRSLVVRDGLATEVGLAIWERTGRAILRDAAGMPAIVVAYDDVVDDPTATVAALRAFLAAHGQIPAHVSHPRSAAPRVVDPSLRHHRVADDHGGDRLSVAQRTLHHRMVELLGPHDALPASELPPETPWVEPVVAAWHAARRGAEDGAWPAALGRALAHLGEAEQRALALAAAADRLEATVAAVESALGYREIGRLERIALRAAGTARRVQRRIRRP
jgi:hypothetical protein